MKRLLTALAAFCALAVSSAAQTNWADVPMQFALRAGAFLPVEDELQDLDEVWFSLGVDAEFDRGLTPGATTLLSLDWFSRNGGANANAFPLTLSQRWYTGVWPKRTYFQVGIGPVFTDFQPADTVFGARGGIGMEFNDRFFAEANFYWSDDTTQNFGVIGAAGFFGIRF